MLDRKTGLAFVIACAVQPFISFSVSSDAKHYKFQGSPWLCQILSQSFEASHGH
jgi:hypothetical protein